MTAHAGKVEVCNTWRTRADEICTARSCVRENVGMLASRRSFLNTSLGLLGSGALLSVEGATPTSVGTTAPRLALVIGNSSYPNSPLSNPVNDAKAIARTLTDLGFQCDLLIDAKKLEMAAAFQAYGDKLSSLKGVGLFYYAGHGAQLGWRNYLVPVDASVASLEDMPRQTLELNSLLTTLKSAGNPMNVIILDACRDNPFGTRVPLEQKGLSQFDAPIGSLLSYATAPGNTASDGEGTNGLFTEHLLREMRVPGAKLEDIFKRVRLQVRLKSRGQQIPWESTSLEDDFYFTGTSTRQSEVSSEQQARLFEEELAAWNAIKDSKASGPLSAYLVRYPNGQYSQLAQMQLDYLLSSQGEKRIEIANTGNSPFTKGTSSAVGRYFEGDFYSFERRDAFSDAFIEGYVDTVSEIRGTQVVFNGGQLVLDLLGNELKSRNPRFLSPAQLFPAEYSLGTKWVTQFAFRRDDGVQTPLALAMKVVDRLPFRCPAGNFNAFKVVGNGYINSGTRVDLTYWIDPERCLRLLQLDWIARARAGYFTARSRTVLMNFSQRSRL